MYAFSQRDAEDKRKPARANAVMSNESLIYSADAGAEVKTLAGYGSVR